VEAHENLANTYQEDILKPTVRVEFM